MTTSQRFLAVPEAFYEKAFSWLRWASLVAAMGFGISATVWKQYEIPLLAVPLIMATVAGAAVGWIGSGHGREEILREFYSNFWLRIQVGKSPSVSSLDLFEELVPDIRDRRKIHRFRTTQGEIYVLNVERFMEVLVSRSMDDLNRATEHALAVAWQRTCGSLRPEIDPLLSKNFREVFKGNLSGSIVELLSNVGSGIINELSAEAEPVAENTDPFELEALPSKPPKKPRKKATP